MLPLQVRLVVSLRADVCMQRWHACRNGMLPRDGMRAAAACGLLQVVETGAALVWSFFTIPAKNLDNLMPIINVRLPLQVIALHQQTVRAKTDACKTVAACKVCHHAAGLAGGVRLDGGGEASTNPAAQRGRAPGAEACRGAHVLLRDGYVLPLLVVAVLRLPRGAHACRVWTA
jgi:hypothetical protein